MSVFKTHNTDVATYLLYEGLKLEALEKDPIKITRIIFRFEDPLGKGRDLERLYIMSEFKKFKDLNKSLLDDVHAMLRSD